MLFVVYGSLVPLQFSARPIVDAWASFMAIPYLQLGLESRADWVANGVLYVPLAFLTTHLIAYALPPLPRLGQLLLAGLFSAALATAIEFGQLFFPPRTVSLNDLIAEMLGSVVGLGLHLLLANWFRATLSGKGSMPMQWGRRLMEAYALAYLGFMFFPFDLLLSTAELAAKTASGKWGWLLADVARSSALVALQLVAELVLTLPFGFLLVQLAGGRAIRISRIVLAGCALGVLVEAGQFLIASGVTQGLSVLTRTLGVTCGYLIWADPARSAVRKALDIVRRHVLILALAYLFLLLYINGWLTDNWHGPQSAASRWESLRAMPFYYHYFTSEARAIFSVMAVAVSYLPVAALCWASQHRSGRAAFVAVSLAALVEAGKLFIVDARPDPTNLLIAPMAVYLAMRLLAQWSEGGAVVLADRVVTTRPGHRPRAWAVWMVPCLAAALYGSLTFPVFPVLLSLLLLVCAGAVWARPVAAFVIIPAALPVLDLAPWSGRFFLDEFDLLLLVVLAVGFARTPVVAPARRRPDHLLWLLIFLLFVSLTVSTVRGLLPLEWPDANAFNNYYSPYNALRIVKGAFWALAVLVLARRVATTGVAVRQQFAWGMVIGLALTVAVILWERVAFSGLWNFSDGYRVTGPFSAIHTGGAYIECFLAAASAYLIALLLERRNLLVRLAGVALLLATTYALMVTFSRNGYAALAVAVLLAAFASLRGGTSLLRSGLALVVLAGAMVAVAVPILQGEFAQARMALIKKDLGIRAAHWKDALEIRDADWATKVWGMGLGRFPETSFWRSIYNPRSGTYRLLQEGGNHYLRLTAGDSVYLEQIVPVEPSTDYVLKLDVRPSKPNANLSVPICEKWMLTSYNCVWLTISLGKEAGAWRRIERHFNTKQLLVSPWYSQRTVKLSFYYDIPASTIDIDNVHLQTPAGQDLLRNGDFSRGLDRWLFSTDGHLQWHTKSLVFGVLFDQGWFGLLALGALTILAMARATRRMLSGEVAAGVSLAALSSFMVVGVFDTLLDAPRYLFLLLALLFACAYRPDHTTTISTPRESTP